MRAGDGYARAAIACRFPIMPETSLGQRLVNAWFDIAFGLATNRRQFRNDEITRPFQHTLLAK